MKPILFRRWVLAAACSAALGTVPGLARAAEDANASSALPLRFVADGYNTSPSFFESMSASFKRGVDAVTSPFKSQPKVETPDDSISLSKKPRGGPELHVAMARLYEQTDRGVEAAKEYDLALKMAPKDPKVLGPYAQYKARLGEFDEAIKYYQQAIRLAPDDPALCNDLALCLARRERYPEAISQLSRAVQLLPSNALYRNNIAAVLVEMNQPEEALKHLRAVHPEAVAHYNLGYLLNKRGQSVAAAQEFAIALHRDPSMEAAKYWLNRIGAHPGREQEQARWVPPPSAAPAPPQMAAAPTPSPMTYQPVPLPAQQPAPPTVLQPAMQPPMASGRVVPLPPVTPSAEPAPLPPALATLPDPNVAAPPVYVYPNPGVQAPIMGQMPQYQGEIRRQSFEETIENSSPASENRVQHAIQKKLEALRSAPPPTDPCDD